MPALYLKNAGGTAGSGSYLGPCLISTAFIVGDVVTYVGGINILVWECTVAGTTAGTLPNLSSTTVNTTVVSGTATFTSRWPNSWALAHWQLSALAVGDKTDHCVVYVSEDYTFSTAFQAVVTSTNIRIVSFICCDKTSGEPPTTLATTATISGNIDHYHSRRLYYYGFHFLNITIEEGYFNYYDHCTFENVSFLNPHSSIYYQCIVKGTTRLVSKDGGLALYCTYESNTATSPIDVSTAVGVDLSSLSTSIILDNRTTNYYYCKLPNGWNNFTATSGVPNFINLINTSSFKFTQRGSITISRSETIYRINGASDGTANSISYYRIKTHAVSHTSPRTLSSPYVLSPFLLAIDVTFGSPTFTVEIVHDSLSLLNTDMIWLEALYLGDATSKLLNFKSTRNLLSPVVHPTSSVSWITTGLINPIKQKLQISLPIRQRGLAYIFVGISVQGKTIYIDPLVE